VAKASSAIAVSGARDAREDEVRRILIEYLFMKARTEDWHGVADAAMDLRELDAKVAVLKATS
jgi:hypothetical protein